MGRSKPDDVKVTTSGGLSVIGEITLSSGGKPVKLGSDTTEHMLPAKRMEHATTKLQDAMSALKLAAEELHIVDAEMIGSDANRRVRVDWGSIVAVAALVAALFAIRDEIRFWSDPQAMEWRAPRFRRRRSGASE